MSNKKIISEIEFLCDRMTAALHGGDVEAEIEEIGQKLSERYDSLEDHDPENADEALRAIRFCLGEIENQSEDLSLTGQIVRITRKNIDYLEHRLAAGETLSYLQTDGAAAARRGRGMPD